MADKNEKLGQAIDSLESITTGLINMTTLPDKLHVQALRDTLPDLVVRLKEGFVVATGENPWITWDELNSPDQPTP